jgi:hypothetical protein
LANAYLQPTPLEVAQVMNDATYGLLPGLGDAYAIVDAVNDPSLANIAIAVASVVGADILKLLKSSDDAASAVAHVVGDTAEATTPILGTARKTTSRGIETAHASTSVRTAGEMAASSQYTRVHMNQTINTITDGAVNSRLKPDTAWVRPDGKVDVTEVLSPGQKREVNSP